ncbi:cytochrome P450 [Marasmius fiardii PR-910]|nr:cytochrome P450 [Marasmius fiardii PR-910]
MAHYFTIGATFLLGLVLYHTIKRSQRRLPPGPPGYPIIGNLFDVGDRQEWLTYRNMSEDYNSDIIYLNMFGTSVVVLNSIEAAQELFDKRSSIYSDRPRFTMLNELTGMSFHLGFMQYGDWWNEHRKLFKKEFQPPATELHKPALILSARTLLLRFLHSPDNLDRHLRHVTGMFILTTSYGIDVATDPTVDDPYVKIGEKCLQAMAAAGNSTQFLVDQLPVMKYIPEWVPGAAFQRYAREWKKSVTALPRVPMEFVKKSMKNGTAKPCVATRVLQETEEDDQYRVIEELLENVLGAAYAAATDTTVSAVESFILAMLFNPDIQKKAQKAVDEVIGDDRLPDFSDMGKIPYVDALLKEALRWNPVTPLAVPHRLTVDDEYKGYHIPAGSLVIGNAWSMLHDETTYGPNPESFNPERFLTPAGELNPQIRHPTVAFGFGRRQCPGNDLAEMSMWVTIASILLCFDINKFVDDVTGEVVEPLGEYTSGMLCYPLPFKCSIKPRSARVEALIRNEFL